MNAQITPVSVVTVEPEPTAVAAVVEQPNGVGSWAASEDSSGRKEPDLVKGTEIDGKRVFYDDREVYGM